MHGRKQGQMGQWEMMLAGRLPVRQCQQGVCKIARGAWV
jgi:hypothetical protein